MYSPDTDSSSRAGSSRGGTFLGRLARSKAGATLPMMGMALIPIAGMIGSGLDMSRAYMTKAKMQTACDAAALATRRFMSGGAFTDAAKAEGEKFFNFNFPPGTMGTDPVDLKIGPSEADASVVEISATTSVPTTVMAMFGNEAIDIAVQCDADLDFVNNDIMLVLDVTASMNCRAGSNCSYATSEQSNSRLSRLRNAAAALYRALEDASNVRTRYGFMPYSMTVNVGDDLDPDWLRNPASYWQCDDYDRGGCDDWDYKSVDHDEDWFDDDWDGCVEERSTISQNPSSSIRISSDVSLADIDAVSETEADLQWQPYDDEATEGESGSGDLARFCPAPATRLAEYATEAAFQEQLEDSLDRVGGYTNHDLGIMWGARYLSSTGMFAADNPTEIEDDSGNKIRVDKHIVFLTDGEMTANSGNYSAFGVPSAENRMTGSGGLVEKHKARFLNACNRVRSNPMNVTVWVIALDVGSTSDIKPCASGEGYFYESNGENLEQIFDLIGKGIGKLRLTQ